LESLSFQSYDHALHRIYDHFFAKIIAGNGGMLTRALKSVNWHVKDVASWEKLRAATAAMTGLKKLGLTVQVDGESAAAAAEMVQTLSVDGGNSSVEEIVVDFLRNERHSIAICCFGSSSNVRSGSSGETSSVSAAFFASSILPHFSRVASLTFDNFKTIPFAPFASGVVASPLPQSLRRLVSPTTSVNFVAGEFKRFVEDCFSLEELRLGFAGGIPAEEMESVVHLRQLKVGAVQFDAVKTAAEIAAGMDLGKIENQKVFHERILTHFNPNFLASVERGLPQLEVLQLFFEVVPIGAQYLGSLKNGISTGLSIKKKLGGGLETETISW